MPRISDAIRFSAEPAGSVDRAAFRHCARDKFDALTTHYKVGMEEPRNTRIPEPATPINLNPPSMPQLHDVLRFLAGLVSDPDNVAACPPRGIPDEGETECSPTGVAPPLVGARPPISRTIICYTPDYDRPPGGATLDAKLDPQGATGIGRGYIEAQNTRFTRNLPLRGAWLKRFETHTSIRGKLRSTRSPSSLHKPEVAKRARH